MKIWDSVYISHRKSIHKPNLTPSLLPVLFVLLQRKKIIFKLFFYSSLKVTGDVKQNAEYNLPFLNLKPEKEWKGENNLILIQDWLWPFSKLHIGFSWILWKVLMEFKKLSKNKICKLSKLLQVKPAMVAWIVSAPYSRIHLKS